MNKKTLFLLLSAAVILVMNICGSVFAESDEISVIYSDSELYTREDMEPAVKLILDEFNTWEGCVMHRIVYAGDDQCRYELEYVKAHYEEPYDEVIIFDSAFRSPKPRYGAWLEDKEYVYNWILARTEKGEWNLINWGWDPPFMKSEIYTPEELTAAMDLIQAELDGMEGVELHYMKYAGDTFSRSQLDYVNSLERGSFDECAVFSVWFQSPVEAYGAWEADTVYNWTFFLARADKGDWQILNFGY